MPTRATAPPGLDAGAGDQPSTSAPPAGNELQNGVPVSGISGVQGTQQYWTMNLPSGATNLQFQTSGGTGDADLHVKFGSAPTLSSYDCRPFVTGNQRDLHLHRADRAPPRRYRARTQ